MFLKIQSIDHLKQLACRGPIECQILLDHGAKTSTPIQHFPGGFDSDERNDIDSYQWDVFMGVRDMYLEVADDNELLNKTHIGEAIAKGALIALVHDS